MVLLANNISISNQIQEDKKTYRVAGIDTGVDNVGASARSSRLIVCVGVGSLVAVGDTSKAPGRAGLGDEAIGRGNTIVLNVLDLLWWVLVY